MSFELSTMVLFNTCDNYKDKNSIIIIRHIKKCTLYNKLLLSLLFITQLLYVHVLSKRIQTPANICHSCVDRGKNRSITLLIEHRASLQTLICAN